MPAIEAWFEKLWAAPDDAVVELSPSPDDPRRVRRSRGDQVAVATTPEVVVETTKEVVATTTTGHGDHPEVAVATSSHGDHVVRETTSTPKRSWIPRVFSSK